MRLFNHLCLTVLSLFYTKHSSPPLRSVRRVLCRLCWMCAVMASRGGDGGLWEQTWGIGCTRISHRIRTAHIRFLRGWPYPSRKGRGEGGEEVSSRHTHPVQWISLCTCTGCADHNIFCMTAQPNSHSWKTPWLRLTRELQMTTAPLHHGTIPTGEYTTNKLVFCVNMHWTGNEPSCKPTFKYLEEEKSGCPVGKGDCLR